MEKEKTGLDQHRSIKFDKDLSSVYYIYSRLDGYCSKQNFQQGRKCQYKIFSKEISIMKENKAHSKRSTTFQ